MVTRMAPAKRGNRSLVIRGMGASTGIAYGPARIVYNIQDLENLKSNEVLVTPVASPDIVLAINKAVAVVTDAGGVTSHAAIICRQFHIPCVVGAEGATKLLKDHMMVKVDGERGVVYSFNSSTPREGNRSREQRDLSFFGRKVTSVSLTMNRNKPVCPDHWDEEWPEVDMNQRYHWIPYRPEMYVEPVASFLLSAIEKGPYVLNFAIGPLYARFHDCNIYLRLDKVQEILALLTDKLLNRDKKFVEDFKEIVHEAYTKLDGITKELETEQYQFSNLSSTSLLGLFKRWWKVCDDFFSLNVLIAAMGVDIVWPKIRAILKDLFSDDVKVSRYLSGLARLSTNLATINFYHDCSKQIHASKKVKALVLSNLDSTETLEIISEFEEGKEWLVGFKKFIHKWGWMRDRLLYFEPINREEDMIRFLKKHYTHKATLPASEENDHEFENCIQDIRNLLPEKKFHNFLFYLDFGRFLQRERDNRFIFMMKNSDIVRKILIELGSRLQKEGVLHDQKDIFFLLVREVFELFSSKTGNTRKEQISSKVPNRMIALTYKSKLRLHDRPGYDPTQIPERDGEFY